jgi:hypothetical protein
MLLMRDICKIVLGSNEDQVWSNRVIPALWKARVVLAWAARCRPLRTVRSYKATFQPLCALLQKSLAVCRVPFPEFCVYNSL